MSRLRRVVVALGVLLGGWLAFDGSHALILGDYVTPASGAHAGRLGPWAGIVETTGIDPRSTLMKSVHVGLGVAWLAAAAGFARRRRWGRLGLLACATLSLWYLPFGTLVGGIEVGLLAPSADGG